MGIPGFQKYVEKYWKRRLKWSKLEGKLIVDGSGLYYELYRKIENEYPLHGGQYPLYLSVIRKFMHNLHASGIEPIFIFDGIYDEDRIASIKTRNKNKVVTWYKKLTCASDDPQSQSAPLLMKQTFLQALEHFEKEDKVRYIYFVDGEADPAAVAMANTYNCPVLSDDSDYYMFNIEAGFIHTSCLQWEELPVTAQIYKRTDFCRGNNILTESSVCLAIPAIKGKFVKEVEAFHEKKVKDLVTYICDCKMNDLLAKICDDFGKHCYEEVKKNHEKAVKYYNVENKITEETLKSADTKLKFKNKDSLPPWIVEQYRKGKFAINLMMTATLYSNTLSFVPDNPLVDTAHKSSEKIRKAIYGILTPQQEITEETREVFETVRVKCEQAESVIPLSLLSINSKSDAEKAAVFKQILGINNFPENLDEKWHLVVAASCYWVKEVKPEQLLIKALILSFVMCHKEEFERGDPDYRDLPEERWRDLHTYAQWQCIYLETIHLNNLLQNPLEIVSPAYLFDGQLVMYYSKQNSDFFNEATQTSQLFECLLHAIDTARLTTMSEQENPLELLTIEEDEN